MEDFINISIGQPFLIHQFFGKYFPFGRNPTTFDTIFSVILNPTFLTILIREKELSASSCTIPVAKKSSTRLGLDA
ncbi:hypothetical protein SESBI_09052 [Sesbania bispinosa]|nr:hypothetical protein SESBI_09052 [Sesbania bispinosa]